MEVKNFQDFIKSNLLFLNGEYKQTAYHCGPVHEETIPILFNLKILNKLGMFTYDSEPPYSEERFIEINGYGYYELFQQRAYLEGYIENKNATKLKKFLDSQNDIYYSIEYSNFMDSTIPFENEKYFHLSRIKNYIKDKNKIIDLTDWEYCTPSISSYGNRRDNIDILFEEHIQKHILSNCISLLIVSKDFGTKINLQKLMIEYFIEN